MANVNVVTILPARLAADLAQKKRIVGYNALPHINKKILEAVREYMTDNVGYEDLPLACLNASPKLMRGGSNELFHYLPANSKDGVVFVLQMPEDMIVSVAYNELLRASEEADECEDDEDSTEMIKDEFKDLLTLGQGDLDGEDEIIEFVPYLDYTRCKGYAQFDEDFDASDAGKLKIAGVHHYTLARLTAFLD